MTFHVRTPPPGSRPGTLAIPDDAPPPRIHVFQYRGEECREADVDDPALLRDYLDSDSTIWVHIAGFGDEAKLRAIADLLGLHPLALETATNVPQRARSDAQRDYHLIVARVPTLSAEGAIAVPQVCLVLGPNFVVTFQDQYLGFFDPVRQRIRDGIGPIRTSGPDYLTYALLDALVDHYFPIVEHLAAELEEIEERIDDDPDAEVLRMLHQIRRKLVVIRRVGWPQREALRGLPIGNSRFLGANALSYLSHTEQHMAQIMEAVDSSRDMTTSLVDIYLSNVSQRTNDVMKVLTLMASIFIPLTFIAGIYGMNFEYMPELNQPRAYPVVVGLMVSVAVGMLIFFWRKGWIGRRRKRD